MAAPTVTAKGTTYNAGGDTSTHVIDLPNSIASGDLLIVMFTCDSNPTVTWPTDWTNLYDLNGDGTVHASARYRIAGASEGTSITLTTSSADVGVAFSWRIGDWHGTTPPQAATVLSGIGGSTAPNPPSLTPTWGSEENMWIALHATNGTASTTVYPTNYATDQEALNSTGGASNIGAGVCTRGLTGVSEDPGAFTIDSVREWIGATVAVRPAAAGGGGGSLVDRTFPRGVLRGELRGAV